MNFHFVDKIKTWLDLFIFLFYVRQACNLMLVLEQLILLALGLFYITSLIMISQKSISNDNLLFSKVQSKFQITL